MARDRWMYKMETKVQLPRNEQLPDENYQNNYMNMMGKIGWELVKVSEHEDFYRYFWKLNITNDEFIED